jgi:hypothetical protein
MNIYSKLRVEKTLKNQIWRDIMPNKDGTGPDGKGPKTGKQRGNCEGAKPQAGNGRCCGENRRKRAGCRRGRD